MHFDLTGGIFYSNYFSPATYVRIIYNVQHWTYMSPNTRIFCPKHAPEYSYFLSKESHNLYAIRVIDI